MSGLRKNAIKRKDTALVVSPFRFSIMLPSLAYLYIGWCYATILLVEYVEGLLLRIASRSNASWSSTRLPFWLTMRAFLLLQKVQENRTTFFEAVNTSPTKRKY